MAGTCECGNEPSGSIKCGEFIDYLKTGLRLKKDCTAWSKGNKGFNYYNYEIKEYELGRACGTRGTEV